MHKLTYLLVRGKPEMAGTVGPASPNGTQRG